MTRRSLFVKYVVPMVLLVSGALLVGGAVQIYVSYHENTQALGNLQREKALSAALRIEQFVVEVEHQLEWIAQTPWGPRGVPIEQRRLDSLRLLRHVPAVTEIAHIDPSGKERLRVSRLAMDVLAESTGAIGSKILDAARTRRVYFGPIYFRKESEPYMTLALAGRGDEGGAIVAETNLKFIWDVVSALRVGKAGYAYVVDANGRLIAHPDISLVLQKTELAGLPQVVDGLRRLATPPTTEASAQVGRSLSGGNVLSAHATIESLGWLVFVDVPLDEAYDPLYFSALRTAGLVVLGLIVSILAALFIVRRMVAPIRVLRAGAARIGGGDLSQRIHVTSGDELQDLAEEFNRMSDELREFYGALEDKVQERTRELTEALAQLEQKGVELEAASKHKSLFLANMSHELRTPLNAILGYTELITDGIYGEAPERIQEVLGRVQKSGRHLLGLINDVLDLSKIEAGQLTLSRAPFVFQDVVGTVKMSMDSLAAEKKLALDVTVAPGTPEAIGDVRRLTQVLLNLVGNAVKFTDQGGVSVQVRQVGQEFEVSVRDTGPGIPLDQQTRIFEEFQQAEVSATRNKGGTGLGLAISKRIVELHGGRIWVESAPGAGSTFFFTIPLDTNRQAL